jgi:26S proteasome regulatory subunit N7
MSSSEERKQRDADDVDEKETAAADAEMKEDEPSGTEGKQHPLLSLATDLFVLALPESQVSAAERAEITARVNAQVEADSMVPFHRLLVEKHGWKPLPASKLASMEEANAKALAAAEAKITEAHEVAGDTEVREAMLTRANLHAQWGDAEKAFEEYNLVFDKTVGIASKVDVLLARMRVALAFDDLKKLKGDIERAKALIEQGGDWERKNALAVYEALYLMHTRRFAEASKLLLDAVATFTTTELFSYSTFVLHACTLALISVDRAALRELLKSPEILSVIDDVPDLRALLTSLYKCNYRAFFAALSAITPTLQRSPYLAPHVKYYLRELRVVAYSQFLRSYKAASLAAMADSFGVSAAFMDQELFRFIAAGRIHAKIDKVAAVVDTNRPDKRNEIYGQLVKNGDLLLNRMHKLSKVIAL